MSGMDGISSLQKMLGALTVNNSPQVSGTAAAAAQAAGKASSAAAPETGGADRASLSASGGMATSDTSDVRMTKVAELRQAISTGSYNVSASAVADKMVESLLR